jgi:hypothetical protein
MSGVLYISIEVSLRAFCKFSFPLYSVIQSSSHSTIPPWPQRLLLIIDCDPLRLRAFVAKNAINFFVVFCVFRDFVAKQRNDVRRISSTLKANPNHSIIQLFFPGHQGSTHLSKYYE